MGKHKFKREVRELFCDKSGEELPGIQVMFEGISGVL